MDCKVCVVCKSKENEKKLLFCDICDRAQHMYCCEPVLKRVPKGEFICNICKLSKGEVDSTPSRKRKKRGVGASSSSPRENGHLTVSIPRPGDGQKSTRRGRPPQNVDTDTSASDGKMEKRVKIKIKPPVKPRFEPSEQVCPM